MLVPNGPIELPLDLPDDNSRIIDLVRRRR
jgi:hypothetical protein